MFWYIFYNENHKIFLISGINFWQLMDALYGWLEGQKVFEGFLNLNVESRNKK